MTEKEQIQRLLALVNHYKPRAETAEYELVLAKYEAQTNYDLWQSALVNNSETMERSENVKNLES